MLPACSLGPTVYQTSTRLVIHPVTSDSTSLLSSVFYLTETQVRDKIQDRQSGFHPTHLGRGAWKSPTTKTFVMFTVSFQRQPSRTLFSPFGLFGTIAENHPYSISLYVNVKLFIRESGVRSRWLSQIPMQGTAKCISHLSSDIQTLPETHRVTCHKNWSAKAVEQSTGGRNILYYLQ